MGKFEGVLLCSDFDDTLTNSAGEVSRENYDAIKWFVDNGGVFTVNTGRAVPAFRHRFGLVPINAPVVLSNGAIIYDFEKETNLYTSLLPERVRPDCAEIASAVPEIGFEAYNGDDIYVHNPNLVTHLHMRKVKLNYTQCPIESMPLPWVKVIFQQKHHILERVADVINERFSGLYEVVFSNAYLLEMTSSGCNKGSSMLRVAEMCSIGREHIYAIGDNQNDLAMLKQARIGFAPRDCEPSLAEWGARLVGAKDEHPLRDVVDELGRIYV